MDSLTRNDYDKEIFKIFVEREDLLKQFLVFHSSSTGDLNLLTKLVEEGVSVSVRDYDKRTPLHLAACEDHLKIVLYLYEKKADINAEDRWGNTPLQNATMHQSYRVISFLREHGGELGKNGHVEQSLFEAAINDDIEQLRLLFQTGVSINSTDFDGRTAMHKAAAAGNVKAVHFLVQHGAKLNVKDKWGVTPLDCAKENKKRAVVQVLSHSFSVDNPDEETEEQEIPEITEIPEKPETLKHHQHVQSLPVLSNSGGLFGFLRLNEQPIIQHKTKTIRLGQSAIRTKKKALSQNYSRQAPATLEQLAREEAETRVLFTGEVKKTSTTLYEQFLVIGAASDDKDPAVIFKYPAEANMDVPPGLADFCFPNGRESPLVPHTEMPTNSPNPNPPQLIHNSNPQNSFVFVITNKRGQRLYCLAVIDDVLKGLPPFIPKTAAMSRRRNVPLCYCIITQFPLFQSFFKFLYNVLDTMYYNRLIQEQSAIPNISQTSSNKDNGNMVIELLEEVYRQIVPAPGQILRIVNSKVRMPFPSEEYQQICQYAGETIFHFFSERKFVWLLCTILCEYKIVFICSDLRKLSSVVLSFIAILNPLVYQASIIPILPDKMACILEAPCPFLAGVTNIAPLKKIDQPEDLVVIHLEVQSQDVPEKPVLPDLPNQNRLLETLSYFYPKKRSRKESTEQESNPLIVQINSYIASLLHIEKHCITDLTRDVTVFWAENFFEDQSEEDLPFYKIFVNTQMFQNFTDRYLREYDRKRRIESPRKDVSEDRKRRSNYLRIKPEIILSNENSVSLLTPPESPRRMDLRKTFLEDGSNRSEEIVGISGSDQ